jgi:hypothetical protein
VTGAWPGICGAGLVAVGVAMVLVWPEVSGPRLAALRRSHRVSAWVTWTWLSFGAGLFCAGMRGDLVAGILVAMAAIVLVVVIVKLAAVRGRKPPSRVLADHEAEEAARKDGSENGENDG